MRKILDLISEGVDETLSIAQKVADILREKRSVFVAFFGDLGTGKTAFVRGLCSSLCPNDRVFSPTFAIINEYVSGDIPVYHFDVYRINDDDDLYSTGFYEYLDRGDGIILCEWSENIPYALPESRIEIHIEKTDTDRFPDRRYITIYEY